MIKDDAQLAATVERINRDLADVQAYLGGRDHPDARIRFPRGYLREAAHFRERFWFIGNSVLRRNLGYACLLSDLYRWLMNRTDIQWSALEMVIKEGICLWAAVCESVTKAVAEENGVCGRRVGFKDRCNRFYDLGYISDATRDELHWLWDARVNEHIFLVPDREHQMYLKRHYNRAVKAQQALICELDDYFDRHPPL